MTGTALQDPFGLTGTVLEGQYRAEQVVGEGGFGVVYRGWHLSLDQPIAIKVLKGLDGGDPKINDLILEKFRAEARLLYKLSQSSLNIVRSLDFGATTTPVGAWAPFMVLEWLDGRSLADDLEGRRRQGMKGRSVTEAFAILEPVAEGLSIAHQQHVAHRDIKPANIFLLGAPGASGDAQAPRVKVLDFGIAKIMKEGESAGTKGTFASFTWLYASPEQLEPRLGATGLATDVYATALLLTELLTDRQPTDERDVVALMKAAMNPERRPTPRTRGANIPDAIEDVCRRALAVQPKDRFASVAEFWAALAAARGGRGRVTTATHAAVPPSSVMLASPPSTLHTAATTMAVPSYGHTPPSASRITAAPPSPMGPPRGTRPPSSAIATPPPFSPPQYAPPPQGQMGPPPGTAPPGFHTQMPYPQGPPRGTAPPGHWPRRLPFVPTEGVSPLVIGTIVVFVLALLLAGSCAVVSAAC